MISFTQLTMTNPIRPTGRPTGRPWLQPLLLLWLVVLQSFAFAQVIVLPDTGESALPDPPEFIYVQREPSPMVAGQPYSLSWETQGGGVVTYSCTSTSGGYTIGTTTVSGKGTLSGTANAAWIGKPSNCVWRVKNAGGEDVVYEDMITVAAPLVNKAAFISQNVPTTMLAGQSYRIQITMQNTGTTTWQAGVWKLGAQNPMETPRWGLTRVALASNVAPGASNTFDFTVTAPTTPGVANLQWGMLQEGEAWFGATSTNVAVNVVAAKNDAVVVSQSVPTSMVAGQIYPISVTMKNTGTTTWIAGTWKLGAQNPMDTMRWGLRRVEMGGNIAPNASVTFSFKVTAPTTTGVANMQWGMVQEGEAWFGAMSSNVAVTVTPPPPTDPTITVTREANPMTAGKTTQLSWTSTYAITVARVCTSTGTGYTDSSTLKLSDTVSITANASWIGFPSSCIWTATASDGKTAKVTENDIVTLAAPPTLPLPTISVTREPNPMVAGRDFTLRWSTTHTATLTRKCTTTTTGGFVSDGAMVITAIDATTSTGSLPAAKADVNWVGKPSTCTWTATSKEGKTKEFTETMTTDAAPTGPQITYIHTDGLGSPVARTDEKGNVISRTRYEPYGATAGGTTPTIGFTGHVNDADTGLTYMQQRYYDPVAGRFMSVDPVLTDANTGASFNRYVYANNSPYKYVDRDGRFAQILLRAEYTAVVYIATELGAATAGVAIASVIWNATHDSNDPNAHAAGNSGSSNSGSNNSNAGSNNSGAGSNTSSGANSGNASNGGQKGTANAGTLPKPPTGPGSVPKADRDPQRFFPPGDREAKREEQGNKCANGCGATIDASNSAGHHVDRHADGGRTVPENHAEVCKDCHKDLHSGK